MLRVRSPRPLLRALFAILCLQMVGGRPAHAEIIYVPDDYPTIQQAIEAAAEEGDEIIVHPGTYYKTIDFLGKAIWLHSSDGAAVTTIHGHNAERVVQCISGEGADTRLEGFTIQAGYVPTEQEGAGMLCIGASPTVIDCRFFANEGSSYTSGGGMYIDGGTPTIIGCAFIENEARWGGGLCCRNTPRPVIMDCTFTGNIAHTMGGGMGAWYESEPLVIGCTFVGNEAGGSGGGLRLSGLCKGAVINCRFSENSSNCGAGVYVVSESDPLILNCTFDGNVAGDCGGGGLGVASWVNLLIVGCVFHHNSAGEGGALACDWNTTITATNCTLYANEAPYGGGLFLAYASGAVLDNCILWHNAPNQIHGTNVAVSYSDIEGGWPGPGNIDTDPLFADPENGDLHLQPGSPCIDAADNEVVPPDEFDLDEDGDIEEPIPFDLDWNPRFIDDPETEDTGHGNRPIVDMGAYEFQPPECPADFDGDGDVDTADLLHLLGAWGTPDGDVDGDGDTDTADLLILLAAWGECPDSTRGTRR